jgi:hypothetical protein
VWVRGWAIATVGRLDRVGHVGLVVSRVQVYAIPAAGEDDLSAEAIGTVMLREGGIRTRGKLAAVVEADIADRTVPYG